MPSPSPWLLLVIAIGAEVLGTSCLRLSAGLTRPLPTLVVLSSYATAMLLLSRVVLSLPLGLTYALWSGIGIVAIVLVGIVAYRQIPGPQELVGIGLISLGVVIVNLGRAAEPR